MTPDDYRRVERLMDTARAMHFRVTPTRDHLELAPIVEGVPANEHLNGQTAYWARTVDEALAWLDGQAWGRFVEHERRGKA